MSPVRVAATTPQEADMRYPTDISYSYRADQRSCTSMWNKSHRGENCSAPSKCLVITGTSGLIASLWSHNLGGRSIQRSLLHSACSQTIGRRVREPNESALSYLWGLRSARVLRSPDFQFVFQLATTRRPPNKSLSASNPLDLLESLAVQCRHVCITGHQTNPCSLHNMS